MSHTRKNKALLAVLFEENTTLLALKQIGLVCRVILLEYKRRIVNIF
jgi:hypothetical protein